MSRNGFKDCEREYNRREEAIEMAKYQRSEAERVGSPQPNSNTQSSDHPSPLSDVITFTQESLGKFERETHNAAIDAAAKVLANNGYFGRPVGLVNALRKEGK